MKKHTNQQTNKYDNDATIKAISLLIGGVVALGLLIRGGALSSLLQVETIAKSAAVIIGLQGLARWLVPETCLDMDISKEEKGLAKYLMKLDGTSLLGASIPILAILSQNVEPIKALGMGCLPFLITAFINVINGSSTLAKGGQVFMLLEESFLAHALLTGADYATTATKVCAVFWLGAGLQCRLDPEGGAKFWGVKTPLTDKTKFLTKKFGQNLMHAAVLFWFITCGENPTKAYGYSIVPSFLSLAFQCFIEKDKAGLAYPCVALTALLICTLGI